MLFVKTKNLKARSHPSIMRFQSKFLSIIIVNLAKIAILA